MNTEDFLDFVSDLVSNGITVKILNLWWKKEEDEEDEEFIFFGF